MMRNRSFGIKNNMTPSQCNCNTITTDKTYKTKCDCYDKIEPVEFIEKKIHPKHRRENKYRNN